MNTATYRVRQRQRNTHSQRNITTHSVTDVETQQARTTKNDGQREIAGHHSPHTRWKQLHAETIHSNRKRYREQDTETLRGTYSNTDNGKTVGCVPSLMRVDILSQQRKLFMNLVPIDKVVLIKVNAFVSGRQRTPGRAIHD